MPSFKSKMAIPMILQTQLTVVSATKRCSKSCRGYKRAKKFSDVYSIIGKYMQTFERYMEK